MRTIWIILTAIVAVTASCSRQNGTPATTLNERFDTASATAVTQAGTFVSTPGESVTGTAKVYLKNNKYTLVLADFKTSNGPDLHVYISKEVQPLNFIDLGKLKATMGYQVYDIPGAPDFMQYRYALIHCQQYNHLFGSAQLK